MHARSYLTILLVCEQETEEALNRELDYVTEAAWQGECSGLLRQHWGSFQLDGQVLQEVSHLTQGGLSASMVLECKPDLKSSCRS